MRNIKYLKIIEKEKFNKEKIIKIILGVVSGIIVIICVWEIISWIYQTNQDKKQMAELERQILLELQDKQNSQENDPEIQELINQRNAIDFNKLYEINTDTRGWIKIDKLELAYPIVQSTDNDYYLKKDIYKKNSISGSIFMDYRNSGFDDQNTVIYGHNMKNDSMFGKLDLIYKGEMRKRRRHNRTNKRKKLQIQSIFII